MLQISKNFSRHLSSTVNQVLVIGGGLMGSGIAQVAAQAKYKIVLTDQTEDLVNDGMTRITKSLQRIAKKKKYDENWVNEICSRISTTVDTEKAGATSDLVIEAIVENLPIKQSLFQRLDNVCPPHTILTTNTSSLSVRDISKSVKRLDRFGGLHFFNPVPMMKLVEIIRLGETSDKTFNTLKEFISSLEGKVSVECKDTPGFIVNRLLVPYMAEAMRIVERGDASFRDIDIAMKLGAGYPMGPFELADYVGLDTTNFIISGWHERFPNEPMFVPPKMVKDLVDEGHLGVKTGKGFYEYS